MTTTATAWLASNASNFKQQDLIQLKIRLEQMDESKAAALLGVKLKSPIIALVLNLFLGTLGIHRFYTGSIVLGIIELLTFGGFGILALVDLFFIMGDAKKKNMELVAPYL